MAPELSENLRPEAFPPYGPGGDTSTTSATRALRLGASPNCDITRTDYNLDLELVEQRVTPRTKVILPVPSTTPARSPTAAASPCSRTWPKPTWRATGEAASRARSARSASSVFTPTKLVTTGEGRMIATDDDALAKKCRLIRNFGDAGKFRRDTLGFNYRLNEVDSALGLCQSSPSSSWPSAAARPSATTRPSPRASWSPRRGCGARGLQLPGIHRITA